MDRTSELRMLIRENREEELYFTDEEIRYYFRKNNEDMEATAYELLLIKAEDNSIKLPNGLETNSKENYWLRLAQKYRPNGSRTL